MGPDEDSRPGECQQDQRRPFPVAPRYLDQSTMKPLPERPSPRWDLMKIYDQETRDDPSRSHHEISGISLIIRYLFPLNDVMTNKLGPVMKGWELKEKAYVSENKS
eukprot:g7684.t1